MVVVVVAVVVMMTVHLVVIDYYYDVGFHLLHYYNRKRRNHLDVTLVSGHLHHRWFHLNLNLVCGQILPLHYFHFHRETIHGMGYYCCIVLEFVEVRVIFLDRWEIVVVVRYQSSCNH